MGSLAWCAEKPIYWHQLMPGEVQSFWQHQAENGQLMFKRPRPHGGLQRGAVKGRVRKRVASCVISCGLPSDCWRWGNRVLFSGISMIDLWIPTILGSMGWWSHAANFFHLMGVLSICKQLKYMAEDIIYRTGRWMKFPWLGFMVKLLSFCPAWLFWFFFFFAYFWFFFFLLMIKFALGSWIKPRRHVLTKQMVIIVVYSQEDPADPAWFLDERKKQIEKREQREGKEKKNGE